MDLEAPILKHIVTGQLIRVIKSPFTIGRGLFADFVVESRVVSRTHCTLEKHEDNWTLTDSSTNGTLVNEELYKGALSAKLKHNDEICLGLTECTYKFLLRDESAPNTQIERLRMEENYNSPANESRPHSCSSFDENGISDDILNNLADDLLRKSQKDNENENQPSTSSNAENIPGVQVNLPTSSDQSVQNLNSNNPIEQNDKLESSVDTIIDLDHDYAQYTANEAQPLAPNSPITIDITDDEPEPSTNITSHKSGLVYPITIDITDDNNTCNSDSGNSSTSTVTYSLPDDLQNNENAGQTNSLANSGIGSNRPTISANLRILEAAGTSSAPSRTIVITPKNIPSSTCVVSEANNNKRIRVQTVTSSNIPTYEVLHVPPKWKPMCYVQGNIITKVINPEVSSTTTDNIGNVQAGSSANTPQAEISILEISDSPVRPVGNYVRIQNTATTTDLPQNTETEQKNPSKISHSQIPGTSKDSEKHEETEPPKQVLNQGLDQNKYEEMENELMCIICSNLFVKAVTLGCSHSFCQHCIESWKKNKTDCPICRTKMVSSIRTLVLDNIIEKMMESASEEEKQIRREVIDERQKIADAEIAAKNQQQTANSNRNGRGQGRNRRRNRQPPAPPVQQRVVEDPWSSDSSSNLTEDSEGLDEYFNDNWYDRSDVYYGGYGRCYVCGEPGHWANGCPYR